MKNSKNVGVNDYTKELLLFKSEKAYCTELLNIPKSVDRR